MKRRRPLRKRLLTNNAAVKFSLKHGTTQGKYIGKPPRYAVTKDGAVLKLAKGVPFVHHLRG